MTDFIDRPLVYLAGPYSYPDPVENTSNTIRFADYLQENLDICVAVPHLNLTWHLVKPHPVEHWYGMDLAILKRCDALYRRPGMSFGADREVDFAHGHGIPVFIDNVNALRAWVTSKTKGPKAA